jgi:GNAT superfamily N-acetyltransferase
MEDIEITDKKDPFASNNEPQKKDPFSSPKPTAPSTQGGESGALKPTVPTPSKESTSLLEDIESESWKKTISPKPAVDAKQPLSLTQQQQSKKYEPSNFGEILEKAKIGVINPDLETKYPPMNVGGIEVSVKQGEAPPMALYKPKKEVDTDIDLLTKRTNVVRKLRDAEIDRAKQLKLGIEQIRQRGSELNEQYKSNPTPELERKLMQTVKDLQETERAYNRAAFAQDIYEKRILQTSDSIKKLANDKVPTNIWEGLYRGIKENVDSWGESYELAKMSKDEQIQYAKDMALQAPTIETSGGGGVAQMVGGVIPDIGVTIGFSLAGLPSLGVTTVAVRQGAQQASDDFVRVFNEVKSTGLPSGKKDANGKDIMREASDDEAYDLAVRAAGVGGATGFIEGVVGTMGGGKIVKATAEKIATAGGKVAAKAATKATGKKIAVGKAKIEGGKIVAEKALDTASDAAIAGGMQVTRNVFDQYQGLDTKITEGVAENMAGEVLLSAPINTIGGAIEYSKEKKEKAVREIFKSINESKSNPYELQKLQSNLDILKNQGLISDVDYNELNKKAEDYIRVVETIPTEVSNKQKAADLIIERDELEAKKESVDKAFQKPIDEKINAINDELVVMATPVELKKNTSPTNEKYGTINRNDGKGVVDLTKEEYLREEGKLAGVEEQLNEQEDVEVVPTPAEEVKGVVEAAPLKGENTRGGTWEEVIINKDGVKTTKFKGTRINKSGESVEVETGRAGREMTWDDFLNEFKPNDIDLEGITDRGTPESVTVKELIEGVDGRNAMTITVDWGKSERGINETSTREIKFDRAKSKVEAAPIENPKVVIQGTRQGLETFETANYDSKTEGKVKDARGLKFDKNGVSIEKDNKGNQVVHIAVDAVDVFGRAGKLQVSVIVPEGTNVNTKSIKEIVDAEVAKIKAKGNEDLKLGKVQQSDFTALKDAVVNELKNPSLKEQLNEQEDVDIQQQVDEEKADDRAVGDIAKEDNAYQESRQITEEVSRENPDASILITPKGNDLNLTALYVGKENRGKGIGSKVLESVKKQADKVGKKVVLDATKELDEETDLERLGKFYEANGFTKVGDNKFEYNPNKGDIAKKGEAVSKEESDVESTAKALEDKKSSLDEKAKKLGYIGIKQFNAQNQLNENLTDAEKALLQEYSDFQQEIKNLKDENVIAKLSDDEFSSWSKANDITRDDLGKVVKDEEIELAAKRIRILNARGDSKKAESELKKLKESKKKDNWTIESWKERFDEDVEQSEIDDINSSNKEFNKSIDKAVESLLSKGQAPTASNVESTAKAFALGGNKTFFHASPTKRVGRLKISNAPQFGEGVYLSTNKDLVKYEFGDNVTEVELNIENPVYTNTKQWNDVEREAIRLADEKYGKDKRLKLGEDDTYFRYDPNNLSEIDEIPSIHISDAAKKLGYDAIIDKGSSTYENEVVVLDESKIVYPEDKPKSESLLSKEQAPKQKEDEQEKPTKEDGKPLPKGVQGLRNEGERGEESPELRPEEERKPIKEKAAKGFISVALNKLTKSLKDFQGRGKDYSQQTYDRIVNEAKEGTLNISSIPPIQIWKDKNGNWVILGGHSRTKAFEDLAAGKHELNSKYSKSDFSSISAQVVEASTLEEAQKIAQESNQGAVQTVVDNAKYVREKLLPKFKSFNEAKIKLRDLYGSSWTRIYAYAHLNPNGKAMSFLKAFSENLESESTDISRKMAEWTGKAMSDFDGLTSQHENEIFDYLLENNKIKTYNEFYDILNRRINGIDGFNPSEPLNFGSKVGRGSNESAVIKEIQEAKAEKKRIEDEIKKVQKTETDKNKRDKTISELTKEAIRLNTLIGDLEKKQAQAREGDALQFNLFNDLNEQIENGNISAEQAEQFLDGENEVEPIIADIERKAEGANEAELNEAIQEANRIISSTEEKVSGGLTEAEKSNLEAIGKDAGVNFQEVRNVYNKYGEGKPLSEITLEDYQRAEEKRGKGKKATKQSAQEEIDNLFNVYESIEDSKGMEKRGAAEEFRNMQESIKSPTLKRIFDNIKDIHSQLEKQGLITKTKGCP